MKFKILKTGCFMKRLKTDFIFFLLILIQNTIMLTPITANNNPIIKDFCLNDSSYLLIENRLTFLDNEVESINDWKRTQEDFTNLTNDRITDNLSYSERLLTITSSGIAIFAFIITVMNVILFIWIFVVQRNLKEETNKINAETRRTKEELNSKTEQLYKEMLNSKYGQYDKELRNQIVHEEENQKFENLDSYQKRIFRADKELDENNIRAAINHFELLLKDGKHVAYIQNRIGIAYTKIKATKKALENFEKASKFSRADRKKYILNVLEQHIILGHVREVEAIIQECKKMKIEEDRMPVFITLMFVFYSKQNMTYMLELLKKEQDSINWNHDSNWEFTSFSDCFKEEHADTFSEVFRFANITI